MASGPVNGREVVYYPWDNGKGTDGRPKKEGDKARNRMRTEGRAAKDMGIVEL